jgi:hypothetical protein
MSTFGKKSLVWWDYQNSHSRDNVIRYNHTPVELQLEILSKWYPIGMQVKVDSRYLYKIVDYVEVNMANVWYLKLEVIDPTHRFVLDVITKHPLQIKPLDGEITQLRRDIKINRLLS